MLLSKGHKIISCSKFKCAFLNKLAKLDDGDAWYFTYYKKCNHISPKSLQIRAEIDKFNNRSLKRNRRNYYATKKTDLSKRSRKTEN